MQYCLKLPLVETTTKEKGKGEKKVKRKTFYRISTAYPENIRQPHSPQT
jgi:hypothetical protein